MKYQVGDIFVSSTRGVITIISVFDNKDKTADILYRCKVYDKVEVKEKNENIQETILQMLVKCDIYKHHAVK
jgi:hypothetical protein